MDMWESAIRLSLSHYIPCGDTKVAKWGRLKVGTKHYNYPQTMWV